MENVFLGNSTDNNTHTAASNLLFIIIFFSCIICASSVNYMRNNQNINRRHRVRHQRRYDNPVPVPVIVPVPINQEVLPNYEEIEEDGGPPSYQSIA